MNENFKKELLVLESQKSFLTDNIGNRLAVNNIGAKEFVKNNSKNTERHPQLSEIRDYENLKSDPYEFICIKHMKITNEINNHSILHIEGIIDDNIKDKYIYTTEEFSPISIYYQKDKSFEYLFNGNVINIKITAQKDFYYVYIEARSFSGIMDIDKNFRDFQNINMTTHELIDIIMESYIDIDYEINIPNESIGSFTLQYNETDYEFLKRVLSKYNDVIICDVRNENSYMYFGVPDIISEAQLALDNYSISKDVNEYNDIAKNYNSNVMENNYITYRVTDEKLLDVGEHLSLNNQPFYVKKAEYIIKNGKLENIYYMRLKDGLKVKRIYNMNLIGVSIPGYILEVKRDMVKVKLEISDDINIEEACWFPYATTAASADGGGWYCMPIQGERIRLNLPNKNEKSAFVVNAIEGYNPDDCEESDKNERMSNSDNKSLKTDANKEIEFTPSGVLMEVDGNQAAIRLNKDGTVEIKGQKNIIIACSKNLSITANKEVIIKAQDNVDIVDETGSNLIMTGGNNIKVNGKNTNNNGQA